MCLLAREEVEGSAEVPCPLFVDNQELLVDVNVALHARVPEGLGFLDIPAADSIEKLLIVELDLIVSEEVVGNEVPVALVEVNKELRRDVVNCGEELGLSDGAEVVDVEGKHVLPQLLLPIVSCKATGETVESPHKLLLQVAREAEIRGVHLLQVLLGGEALPSGLDRAGKRVLGPSNLGLLPVRLGAKVGVDVLVEVSGVDGVAHGVVVERAVGVCVVLHPERICGALRHDDVELVLPEDSLVGLGVDVAGTVGILLAEARPQPGGASTVEVRPHDLEHALLDAERKGALPVPLVLAGRSWGGEDHEINKVIIVDHHALLSLHTEVDADLVELVVR
mmetsp:Transcript_27303/g.51749  ORF Transcript_27303/g.51749 Transcript_27303/m.51749 type:complete len:337 (-) Transcript_27303:1036-2046(-)